MSPRMDRSDQLRHPRQRHKTRISTDWPVSRLSLTLCLLCPRLGGVAHEVPTLRVRG